MAAEMTMSIRYAILGLVAEQPLHGYGLKRVFDERMSPLWGLTTGQIYQSLTALERTGLVESARERNGRRPERKVYNITRAGERELHRWLQSAPSFAPHPFREETLVRHMLLRRGDREDLRRSLRRMEDRVARALQEAKTTCAGRSAVGEVFLQGLIDHLEADLKHFRRLRTEIESPAGLAGAPPGSDLNANGSLLHALPPPF
jgi:DNA-binding PadR family transcriptional regulator